jgi:hypothetical protein
LKKISRLDQFISGATILDEAMSKRSFTKQTPRLCHQQLLLEMCSTFDIG